MRAAARRESANLRRARPISDDGGHGCRGAQFQAVAVSGCGQVSYNREETAWPVGEFEAEAASGGSVIASSPTDNRRSGPQPKPWRHVSGRGVAVARTLSRADSIEKMHGQAGAHGETQTVNSTHQQAARCSAISKHGIRSLTSMSETTTKRQQTPTTSLQFYDQVTKAWRC